MRSYKLLICIELCLTALLSICGNNVGLSEAFSLAHRGWNVVRGGGGGNNKNNNINLKNQANNIEQEVFNGKQPQQNDQEMPVEFVAETNLPTDIGHFRLRAYRVSPKGKINSALNDKYDEYQGKEPCVIYASHLPPSEDKNYNLKNVPIRIHDQCVTSEVFRSQRCDCREQLRSSLEYIHKHGGAIIYLQQEGRGIGLANKVAAYAMQDQGMDTYEANVHLGFPEDNRSYGMVPSILKDLGIESIQLMTNNPRKVEKLKSLDVEITGTVPVVSDTFLTRWNRKYISTKVNRMNHMNYGPILTQHKVFGSNMNNLMVPRAGGGAAADTTSTATAENEDFAMTNNTDTSQSSVVVQNAVMSAIQNSTHVLSVPINEDIAAQPVVTASKILKENGYCFGKESVIQAIQAIKNGEMVVVVDDYNRENEGDFIVSAELCTPETLAKLIRFSSGVVCVAMDDDRADALDLPYMVHSNQDPKQTAFTVTVDAAAQHGTTTGISATDRCSTLNLMSNPKSTSTDFTRPGHIFPLRAKANGVLSRDGHTEATVDLMKLAGLQPVGVLCEIVSEENPIEMAQLPELTRFCKQHGFILTSIADLVTYRKETETGL